MKRLALLMVVLLPLALSACMLTGQPSPMSILAPSVELSASERADRVDWSVQIQRPMADAMRDSDRLLVRRAASRLQVYPGAAWFDSVPEMLQSMLVKAFSDSEGFAGVSRSGGIRTRYSVATEIRNFEAVDLDGQVAVEIVLQASLIHQRSARPIAGRTFRHGGPVANTGLDPIVSGFEDALAELMHDMIDWVMEQGELAEAEWAERGEDRTRRWRDR